MDLIKLIQSLPDLLADLALMFWHIPKTFAKVFFRPKWIAKFILADPGTDEKGRNSEYTPAAILWAATGVLSYGFVIHFGIVGFFNESVKAAYKSISPIGGFTSLILYFISLPLSCALVLQWFKHGKVEKIRFRDYFNIQCYCMAVAQFLYIPTFLAIFNSDNEDLALWGSISCLLSVGWFIYTEFVIIRQVLGCGLVKTLLVLFTMYMVSFFFIGISTILFTIMNLELIGAMGDAVFEGLGEDSLTSPTDSAIIKHP